MRRIAPPPSPGGKVDRRTSRVLLVFALLAAVVVFAVAVYVGIQALPALGQLGVLRWFSDAGWHPTREAHNGQFEISAMLIGSLASSLGAMLIALPFGVFSAACILLHLPRRLGRLAERVLQLMAGVPSVVFGLWGLVTVAPWIRQFEPPGTSLLAGVLVLTLMIVPTIALLTLEALRAVPAGLLHGAAALGLDDTGILWRVRLPAAREGVLVAAVLALTRALGETMAVLMVCGNVVQIPSSAFDSVRTLTANIALELGYASGDHRSALYVSGLLLLIAVAGLVLACDRVARRTRVAS